MPFAKGNTLGAKNRGAKYRRTTEGQSDRRQRELLSDLEWAAEHGANPKKKGTARQEVFRKDFLENRVSFMAWLARERSVRERRLEKMKRKKKEYEEAQGKGQAGPEDEGTRLILEAVDRWEKKGGTDGAEDAEGEHGVPQGTGDTLPDGPGAEGTGQGEVPG